MLQFGLRLLVKGRGKEHNSATMTCQHKRRERHAGRATSTFCQRMNIKGNRERNRTELQGKREWDGHYEQRDEVGGGHELVC